MKKTDKVYTLDQVLEAHKKCCPYYSIQMEKGELYMGEPIKCGSGNIKCNDKCHYIREFKKQLKNLKL